ncbi:MAG: STAS/SEC14 domain-containing protein [Methylococcales bacterium]|nr:STAS/SEC14 domain-containing protein [Methylococcales bacterium]
MSAKIINHTDGIVTLKITGLFTYPDQLIFQNALIDMIPVQKISVLTIFEDFQGWSNDDRWEDISFQEQSDPYIKKMALVGEEKWRELALMSVGAGFRDFPIGYFQTAELDRAKDWLMKD